MAGGLTSALQNISKKAFIYNISTNTVEKKDDMIDYRYTFPMAYIHPYIYAVGGRFYGE